MTVGHTPWLVGGETQLALVEPTCIWVFGLPDLALRAEIALDGTEAEAAFAPNGRLIALSHAPGRDSTCFVVDVDGPTKLGEIAVRPQTHLAAVCGSEALLLSNGAASILDTSNESEPSIHALRIRTPVSAAGRTADGNFLLVSAGAVEEWEGNVPRRRVRFERPLDCSYVGGSSRRIWMLPRDATDHIKVISLANRSTRLLELPEPAAVVTSHPSGELLVVVGADTRSVYLVDLANGRQPVLVDRGPIEGAVWVGAELLALLTPSSKLELVRIPTFGSTSGATEPTREVSISVMSARWREEAPAKAIVEVLDEPLPLPVVENVEIAKEPPRAPRPADGITNWRRRMLEGQPDPTPEPMPIVSAQTNHDWRARYGSWAREISDGRGEAPIVHAPLLDDVCRRLALDHTLRPALALSYGAHLAGLRGIAPLDLARALGWRWSEALGSGALAASGALRWHDSRAILADELIATLDERPPCHGTVVRGTGTGGQTIAIIAPTEIELLSVATWGAPIAGLGMLLVPRDATPPAPVVFEANVRGMSPVLRWTVEHGRVPKAATIVVERAETAAALGLSVVATWPR